MLDQLKQTAMVASLMAGLDRATIADQQSFIKLDDIDEKTEKQFQDMGKLLRMAAAAGARSAMDAFIVQGFTREEAVRLVVATTRK
jgi:hypothetical protein